MSFLGELGNVAVAALLLIHALSHTHTHLELDQPRCTMCVRVCVSVPSIHSDDCWVLTFSFTGYITNQLGRNQKRRGEETRRGGVDVHLGHIDKRHHCWWCCCEEMSLSCLNTGVRILCLNQYNVWWYLCQTLHDTPLPRRLTHVKLRRGQLFLTVRLFWLLRSSKNDL